MQIILKHHLLNKKTKQKTKSIKHIYFIFSPSFKGDDRSFPKWLRSTFYLGYTVSITTFCVSLCHKMYILWLYQCIQALQRQYRLKLREMILAPFRKLYSFNNFRKDVKFGKNWIESLFNTLRALYNIFHNGLIHKSLNNIWDSLGMVIFSCGSK